MTNQPGSLFAVRPIIIVEGQRQSDLAEKLLELSIEESWDHGPRCELTLNNWGPTGGSVGFLWFDKKFLNFGRTLAVQLGGNASAVQIFLGSVTGIRAGYPAGSPPRITVLAENHLDDNSQLPVRSPRQIRAPSALSLTYGQELTEFSITDDRSGQQAGAQSTHLVRGQGITSGYQALRVGDAVTLNGLGTIFSGQYSVNLVRFTFTEEQGFRTYFEVERPRNNSSSSFIASPDNNVLVEFKAGDPRSPYVVGPLCNSTDSPPESAGQAKGGKKPRKPISKRSR